MDGPGIFLYFFVIAGQAIRERAKKQAANRKPAAHLMDNLAPHTKRLAETALGGAPLPASPAQNHPASSSSSTATPAGSGHKSTGPAGATAAVSALVTVSGVTAGPPGQQQMARLRDHLVLDEDKLTDQGSGSQVRDGLDGKRRQKFNFDWATGRGGGRRKGRR